MNNFFTNINWYFIHILNHNINIIFSNFIIVRITHNVTFAFDTPNVLAGNTNKNIRNLFPDAELNIFHSSLNRIYCFFDIKNNTPLNTFRSSFTNTKNFDLAIFFSFTDNGNNLRCSYVYCCNKIFFITHLIIVLYKLLDYQISNLFYCIHSTQHYLILADKMHASS